MPRRIRSARFGALTCLSWFALTLTAQQQGAGTAGPAEHTTIDQAWDAVLPAAGPELRSQDQRREDPSAGFLKHLFFEARAEYWRYSSSFTGLPTVTGVINAPFTGVFNPNGIEYQPAFQPDANRLYGFIDWGTRGWLSDHVNTHFAFRYEQDVSHINAAAPAANILETFQGSRRLELLNASVEVNGRASPGAWSIQVGRQYVYGAELAALDGASLTLNGPRASLTIFGGRRFTFFGDPDQRAIGGANATWRIGRDASLEYETLWYIKGSNSIAYRKRAGSAWLLSSYLRFYGSAPADLSAQAIYAPGSGRTTARISFLQKLSSRDYVYDYTIGARGNDAYTRLTRLYLGPFAPYTQFAVDLNHGLTGSLRLGGAVWVRRLNDSADQSAFDTPFQDYRVHAQVFPMRKLQVSLEYHQHDSDRLAPVPNSAFDDMSRSGETSVKDITAELHRSFFEGNLSINGGAYYRRVSMQDRFFVINGMHQSGWLAGLWRRLDEHTRVYADYNLDNDFFLFRPSLKNSRALHVGVSWRY